jgi:predicted Fe-Mo cluster-binding NifX family protein
MWHGGVVVAVKVALSSENGKTVHQHFGQTTQFVICEIDDSGAHFLEVRRNLPPCGTANEDGEIGHNEDRMGRTVALVADCRAVVSAQIGQGAVVRLAERGIQAFVIPDFIDQALTRLLDSGALNEPVRAHKRWLVG